MIGKIAKTIRDCLSNLAFTTPYSIKSHIVRLHSSAASTFEAITTETIVIVTIDVDRPGHPHKQPQTVSHTSIQTVLSTYPS